MTTLIIDNYDSFTFNLYQLSQSLSKAVVIVRRNDDIDFSEIQDLRPKHIILSPGPGHPANPVDFGVCAEIITRQSELACPILGVCLGHQGIAHYLGAVVNRANQVCHGKISSMHLVEQSPLFAGVEERFCAMRYHSLIVAEESLPTCLKVTARDELSGMIMAIEHRERPLYGLQFHPESIGSPVGPVIMENFLSL